MKIYKLFFIRQINNIKIPYTRLVNEANIDKEILAYMKSGYILESIQEAK